MSKKAFLPNDVARCVDNDMCSKRTTCKRHLAPWDEYQQWVITGKPDCQDNYIQPHDVIETTKQAWTEGATT